MKILKIVHHRNEVFVKGKRIHLSPKEYAILCLLKESDRTHSREEIWKGIWGGDFDASKYSRLAVDQHVCRLRKNLGIMAIETVTGKGYRIAAV